MSYRQSRNPETTIDGTLSGAIIAALVASVVFAELFTAIGSLETVAAVYGLHLTNDWAFVVAHGLVAAIPFIGGLTAIARHRIAPVPVASALHSPFLGGCFGVAYGAVCWLVVIAYAVPYWIGVTGGDVPLPYHHLSSLGVLLAYGAVLGVWYPLVRSLITTRLRRS